MLMHLQYATYTLILLKFLRKILGKVLVPHDGRPIWAAAEPDDIILYAIPSGTDDRRIVEIALIRDARPASLDATMDEMHSYMSNATFSCQTIETYRALSVHSCRHRVFLSDNPDQLSRFNDPGNIPGIADKVLARHIGHGSYTIL